MLRSYNLFAICNILFVLVGEEKKPDGESSGEGLFPVKITLPYHKNTI